MGKIIEDLKPVAMLPASITGVVAGTVMLIYTLGAASLIGIIVLAVCMVVNVVMVSYIKAADHATLCAADVTL